MISGTYFTAFLWLFAGALLPMQDPGDDEQIEASLRAVRMNDGEQVTLDGRLEEGIWQRITPSTDFLQQEPREGATPTERTAVRVAYDAGYLYIGVMLNESDPKGILAYQRRRDTGLGSDDRLMWILDTYNDGRNAYFFETNPAGLKGDGLLTTGQGYDLNKSWDGIWDVAVARGSEGWSAEIRIPFRTLNFDPDQSVWGVNFQRTVRRKDEEILWSGHRQNQGLFRPQYAGRLTGLQGLSQGLGLEVTPYGITSAGRQWETERRFSPTMDAGFDLSYSLTTNLRAAVTVNTDFAETEVDQRRVNLTRFPVFFPEKRDFFLEGSSVFTFAPRSGVYPYFSRRIGLIEGSPVPIRFGTRLTGRAGPYDVGFLQIRTGRKELPSLDGVSDRPPEDFTVARLARNIFSESSVGAIYTRRATHAREGALAHLRDRHTVGADLELGTSSFRGDENLQFQAFFVWHNAPSDTSTSSWGHRTGRGVRLTYPNQPWAAHVSYREFGDAYEPAVGFAQRRSFRRLQPSVSYSPILADHPYLRQLEFGLRYEYLTDLRFRTETMETRFTLLGMRFESGDALELDIARNYERLDVPFDLFRDERVIINPDGYRTWTGSLEAETASRRRLVGFAEASHGGFWSGRRTQYAAGLTVKPLAGISLTGSWDHSRLFFADDRYATHLFHVIGNVDLTPETALTTNVQYDNLSDRLGLYGRFRWILRPGSDLYLVYTHNWLGEPFLFRPVENQATAKVTYTHRF